MDPLIVVLILITAIVAIVLASFSRPLAEEQIPELAQKRRKRKILLHFSPSSFSYFSPTTEFKSGLKPDGKLYQFDLEMPHVPSYVAELLKYKKHEWSVIVFLKDQKAEHLWANKGPDRTRVSSVSVNSILNTAKGSKCDTIMAFHNHPAHDPQHYSYRNPSDLDLEAAEKFSQILNTANISYLDHVCERGKAYRYCLNPSPTLYPLATILDEVKVENSQGRITHIRLHFELYL
jgi:hypothetical protein